MLETYLLELERELGRSFSGDDLQTRLAEAEAHLRDGVEARIELGLLPKEAERETVQAFGAVRLLARATEKCEGSVKAKTGWLSVYWALFVPTILWSAFAERSLPDALVQANCLVFCMVGVGFGLAAFRSGHANPLAVLRRSALALGMGAMLLFVTHVVYESDGFPSFVGRARAVDTIAGYEGSAAMALDGRLRDTSRRSGAEIARGFQLYHA